MTLQQRVYAALDQAVMNGYEPEVGEAEEWAIDLCDHDTDIVSRFAGAGAPRWCRSGSSSRFNSFQKEK